MDTKEHVRDETPDRSRLALLGALSAAAAGGGCATIEGGAQVLGSQAIRRARQRSDAEAARRAATEDPRLRTPGSDGDGGGGGGGGGGSH